MKLVYKLCPNLVDEWKNRQGSADYRNSTPMMRACMVKAVNEDLTECLPRIKQDTLLIWGGLRHRHTHCRCTLDGRKIGSVPVWQ